MSLQEVFVDELRDLYSAENQLVKALPKMAKGTSDGELKTIFTEHLEETKEHVERLKQVFQQLGKKPTGEHCAGMEGLVKEGQDQLSNDEEGAVKDVCLIGAALRVEHYETAGYTAAIAIGKTLGEKEIVGLLTQTLNEEKEAAKKILTQAKPILQEAVAEEPEEEDDEEELEDEEGDEEELDEEDEDLEADQAGLEEDEEEEEPLVVKPRGKK